MVSMNGNFNLNQEINKLEAELYNKNQISTIDLALVYNLCDKYVKGKLGVDILTIFDKVDQSPEDITRYIMFQLFSETRIVNFLDSFGLMDLLANTIYTMGDKNENPVVVIDAGHGGKDAGAISANNALEKDINLSIAVRLKSLLEQNSVTVVMTREEDKDLASEHASSRKNEDLRARAGLIEASSPVLMVSVHQNSYPEEEVSGAQVFYYSGSESGKALATMVQNSLKKEIDDENHRVAKANREYYLLKRAICPAVLVECGFLSNPVEAALLETEEYQEKIAFAIHLGIMEYINTIETMEE